MSTQQSTQHTVSGQYALAHIRGFIASRKGQLTPNEGALICAVLPGDLAVALIGLAWAAKESAGSMDTDEYGPEFERHMQTLFGESW